MQTVEAFSEAIRGHLMSSEDVNGHQRASEGIRGHPSSYRSLAPSHTAAIRGHQRPPKLSPVVDAFPHGRNQRASEAAQALTGR
jgi:hypothetical protein